MKFAKFLRTPILKNICELPLYLYVILFTMHEKDTANDTTKDMANAHVCACVSVSLCLFPYTVNASPD